MPMYVYACHECARQFEIRQRFQDDALTQCEVCGGELRRVLQPVGIVFKGSGFYSTDYKSGSLAMPGTTNGASGSSEGSKEGSSEGSKEGSKKGSTSSTDAEKRATPAPAKEAAPAMSSGAPAANARND